MQRYRTFEFCSYLEAIDMEGIGGFINNCDRLEAKKICEKIVESHRKSCYTNIS